MGAEAEVKSRQRSTGQRACLFLRSAATGMCGQGGSWSPSEQHQGTRGEVKSLVTNLLQVLCGLDWIKNKRHHQHELSWPMKRCCESKWHSSLTRRLGRMIGQGRSTVCAVLPFVTPAVRAVCHTVLQARFSWCIAVRKPQSPSMRWHKRRSARDVPVPIVTTRKLYCCLWFLCLCCLLDWWHLPRAVHLQISWLLVCPLTICCDSQDQCVQSVRTDTLSEARFIFTSLSSCYPCCFLSVSGFSTLYMVFSLLLGAGIVKSINLGSVAWWLVGRAVVYQWGCATAASRTVCILAKIVGGHHNTFARLFSILLFPQFSLSFSLTLTLLRTFGWLETTGAAFLPSSFFFPC